MRIVIDMQGAQTGSRTRGAGGYGMALARALARHRGPHDVFLALNGLFPDTILPIRDAFADLLPRDRIRVWDAPGPLAVAQGNRARRERAALIREALLARLDPDIVHVTGPFGGFADDAVTSTGVLAAAFPVSVSLHDPIPLHAPERVLGPNPAAAAHYRQSLADLERADLILANSDFTARDAATRLAVGGDRIVTVPSGPDGIFRPQSEDAAARQDLFRRLGIPPRFVLTSGTTEPNDNLPRLFAAFARVPPDQRQDRTLVLVGEFARRERDILREMAAAAGLHRRQLVVTGPVGEEDLVRLYNACDLMVSPSLAEGFGRPALEAMACGAPTLGAHDAGTAATIVRDDGLFDPADVEDMARLMARALADAGFRESLRQSAAERLGAFSSTRTARTALAAMERVAARRGSDVSLPSVGGKARRPRLAFVSPLPPDHSGIADYSADLIPALAAHYDLTLVSRGHTAFRQPDGTVHTVRSPAWLLEDRDRFDRIVYQFGNSPFHDYMLPLSRTLPGTIVLHDFFLSSLLSCIEPSGQGPAPLIGALYESHGYGAVRACFRDMVKAVGVYPANLAALREAGAVVVHSEHARQLGARWLGADIVRHWRVVPQMKAIPRLPDRATARRMLRIPADAFVVCAFGSIDARKLSHRLIEAFGRSALSASASCQLVLVGELAVGAYEAEIRRQIDRGRHAARVRITGWTDPATYAAYLAAADIGVQLRADSRGETSRAVLESMAAGLPTIINAHGSAAEIPGDAAVVLDDDFADADLSATLDRLFEDGEARRDLGRAARDLVAAQHSPIASAAGYAAAIEASRSRVATGLPALAAAIAATEPTMGTLEVEALSTAIARSIPSGRPDRQLLLDVSPTAQNDIRTGIQRVVRAVALALLESPPAGFRIEPVYLTCTDGDWHYRYARRFTLALLGCPPAALEDDSVEVAAGDAMLILDLAGQYTIDADAAGVFDALQRQGLSQYGTVYDLLPLQMPEHFPGPTRAAFEQWLNAIARLDGVICISAAVADDYREWRGATMPGATRPHHIGWFHLGADIDNSHPTRGMPPDAPATLAAFAARPTFLMVGTIEPRKGHLQAVAAFEMLWQSGVDVNLVIVGAEGWQGMPNAIRRSIPDIVARLNDHPERGRRLFWLNGVSDEYLESVYARSSCLIAASEGEGFGLPLIEAARHGIPILARDIPVFREVAGDHADYFSGLAPNHLAAAVRNWLALHREGREPRSKGMAWNTWEESARRIAALICQWEGGPRPA